MNPLGSIAASSVLIRGSIASGATLRFQNVHYLAAAATLFGTDAQVGYEYDTKTYVGKFGHVSSSPTNTNNCVFCHSPKITQHTFHPEDNIETCRVCHTLPNNALTDIRVNSDADYDGDGKYPGSLAGSESLAEEIETLAAALLSELQTYAETNVGTKITGRY